MDPITKLYEISLKFPKYQKVSGFVLGDCRFPVWSGSSKPEQHHYGKGGLAQHTLEVVELCFLNNSYFNSQNKGVDEGTLFLAALFHDAGKMDDYAPEDTLYNNWTGTNHKRRIHHITRSALIWNEASKHIDFKSTPKGQEIIDDVLHAILSHHGKREYGSPVAPDTKMAWILHLSDAMSARVYDCETFKRF